MSVLGVDVSPVARDLARQLASRSGVADRCRFEVWDLDEGLPPGLPVDLVICHMFREPRLDRLMVDRLRPGGVLAIATLSEVGVEPGRFRARLGTCETLSPSSRSWPKARATVWRISWD